MTKRDELEERYGYRIVAIDDPREFRVWFEGPNGSDDYLVRAGDSDEAAERAAGMFLRSLDCMARASAALDGLKV